MENEKPSYFGIIPAVLRYDEELPANAKLLFSEFTCLSDKYGYCFSSNNYFAKLYNVTPQSISKWIKLLEKKGYIIVEYEYNGKEITQRKIFINVSINVDRYQQKNNGGINTTFTGYQQKIKDNNINNNNINNIPSDEGKETKTKKIDDNAIELSKLLYQECKKQNDKFKATDKQLTQWASDIEKLNRIDGYDYSTIKDVLVWCKNDDFWSINIQSGSKFRKQFNVLFLKAKKEKNQNTKKFENIEKRDYIINPCPNCKQYKLYYSEDELNVICECCGAVNKTSEMLIYWQKKYSKE